MKNNNTEIKKDLYDIYAYFKLISENTTIENVYKKQFLNKFKYSLDEVSKSLGLNDIEPNDNTNSKKKVVKSLNKETSEICNIYSLREFYYRNFEQLFYADVDEKYEKKILKSVTVEELKRLYTIISTVPIKKNKKKKDIIYMFKYYFDDESRTNDIGKKLTY